MKVRHIILGAAISAGALLGGACTTGGDEVSVDAGPGQVASDGTQSDANTPDDSSTAGPTDDP